MNEKTISLPAKNSLAKFKSATWKIAGLLVSLVLLVLAFRNVRFDRLLAAFSEVKLLPVLAVALIDFGINALKSYRWQVILGGIKKVPFGWVFLVTQVGYMAHTFMPARTGELVRIVLLSKKANLSKATVLGTLVLEQALDGVGMLGILLLLPLLGRMPGWLPTATLILVLFLAVLLGLLILLLRLKTGAWTEKFKASARWKAALAGLMVRLREGVQSLRSARTVVLVVLVSIASWFIQAFMVYLCLEAVDLHFSFANSIFVMMAINLAILIPSAPSNLGTFEFAAVLALGTLGVDATRALSFALVYHFVQLIPTTLAGILLLPLLGLKWRDISHGNSAG